MTTTTQPQQHRSWLRRGVKALTPDALLLSEYKLTRRQKLVMFLWGLVLSQVAGPVGDAIYYLGTQVNYGTENAGAPWFTWVGLKDSWDKLPVHLSNLLHLHWFGGSQKAPIWWVVARHDARYVIIGLIGMMMISLLTTGLGKKEHKRVHPFFIFTAPVWVLLAAAPGTAAGILLVSKVFPVVMHWGLSVGNPFIAEFLNKGHWQLILVGVLAFQSAKRVYRPIASTVQLMFLERKIYNGDKPKWWWKFAYLPSYLNRYDYLVARGEKGRLHGKAMTELMMAGMVAFVVFLAYGIWLKYASHILPH